MGKGGNPQSRGNPLGAGLILPRSPTESGYWSFSHRRFNEPPLQKGRLGGTENNPCPLEARNQNRHVWKLSGNVRFHIK